MNLINEGSLVYCQRVKMAYSMKGDHMPKWIIFTSLVLLPVAGMALAQVTTDVSYTPAILKPAYEMEKGPIVAIDEAHHK